MTFYRFKKAIAIIYNILFLFLFLSASVNASTWPTNSWGKSDPVSLGMNYDSLKAYSNILKSGALGYIDGMLVTRAGKIIFE